VTVGQLVAMAANLEGKGASVLDFMGFAQKFGPVISYIRMANSAAEVNQVRVEPGSADALIGCDIVVSSSPKASMTYHAGTRAVVNAAVMPTGDLVQNRDADLNADARRQAISKGVDAAGLHTLDANALSEALLGDTVFANVMMLGAAWQAGLVPLSLGALMKAIDLNGVKPDQNKRAFGWGRLVVQNRAAVEAAANLPVSAIQTVDQMIERRAAFLAEYQDEAWADTFHTTIENVREAETEITGAAGPLTEAATKGLFKLMSYKDEYEVARLHSQTGFIEGLKDRFDGDITIRHHLAPPMLSGAKDARGRPIKRSFGPWMQIAFRGLSKVKRLRGTPFDPFGYTEERRMERALIREYRAVLDTLTAGLTASNAEDAARIAGLVMDIRGFGPVKAEAVARVRAQIIESLKVF
jgi:indolepyruvate ferredoxin oxidoreductase